MKKRIISAALAAVLMLTVLTASPFNPPSVAYAADAKENQLSDQIAALNAKQQELQAKLNQTKNDASKAAENKANLDALVTTVEAKIDAANSLITELEAKVAKATEEIATRESVISVTFEKFLGRMKMSYEDGTASYLDMLLGAESISDFLSRAERVNAMMAYDKSLIKQYETEKAELEQEKQQLEASVALQKTTLEGLEADKAESARLAEQAANYYQTLQKDADAYQREYNAAKAAEAELDRQLQEYLSSLAQQNSSSVIAEGEYVWPVSGGYISCRYGDSDPRGMPHYAYDIAIANGTPIKAANSGTVVTATSHSSYGNYVVIDHGNGIASLYAHCSSLNVSVGQQVAKGQVIARVGSTGFSTGYHLHFEMRENGVRVNPMKYYS